MYYLMCMLVGSHVVKFCLLQVCVFTVLWFIKRCLVRLKYQGQKCLRISE